ncbi:MAG: HD domain-containing protein [Firmicutes bacterium]|nr:HD domain-containing protein [Bacillota bacterium]
MISKQLLKLLFEAASIQRWNDHIRPEHFTELDKQAHKMVYAYVLGKMEETDRGVTINWRSLIEGALFEFFHRIVLTDIKPPIFHKLMAEKGEQLNRWVLYKISDHIAPLRGNFLQRMVNYYRSADHYLLERKILRAAHYLATDWEFKIIYHLNAGLYGLEETKEAIKNQLEEHYDLAGVQKITLQKKTSHFLDLVGQLRFQQRWAQSPRLPRTSVMGHMLIVAILAYLCSLELDACVLRSYNNFFAGLFHDLPEVITRDIVSPVKQSVAGLEELITEIELWQMEARIYPLLPPSWHREIKYFTENVFESKIVKDGEVCIKDSAGINENYNQDSYSPLDGEIIRACDHLAAYMETYLSITHGVKSPHLYEANRELFMRYREKEIAGIDFGRMFAEFKI